MIQEQNIQIQIQIRYIELLEEMLEDVTNLTKIKIAENPPRAPSMIQHCFKIIDVRSNVSGASPKHEKGENPETFE